MNAWRNELGELRVRSVALPSDGGVLEPATERHGRYKVGHVDVAATIAREKKRLAALKKAEVGVHQTTGTTVSAAKLRVVPWSFTK